MHGGVHERCAPDAFTTKAPRCGGEEDMGTRMMSTTRRLRRLAPVAAVLALAACESANAPEASSTLDVQAALQDYQAVDRLFATPGWAGFAALSGRTPMSSRTGVSVVSSLAAVRDAGDARHVALALFASVHAARTGTGPSSVVLISPTYRGATFAYDAASGDYQPDPARSGAPANGVRFVTYAVDAQGRPIVAQEIGYADLTDEGTANDGAVALRLQSVVGNRTALDYRVRLDEVNGTGRLDITGFVADDAERLTFSINATSDQSASEPTVDVDFELRLANRSFSVVGLVRDADGSGGDDARTELTVRHGGNTLGVALQESDGEVDGAITLNGALFVTVTGAADEPTLRGATGNPLTGGELLVMLAVVDVVHDVFQLLEDLVQPVDNLLVLGWLL